MQSSKHQGFNLIELMIAFAIVAILAAFAVPAYNRYVIRSKVTQALTTLGPLKQKVAAFYTHNGVLPRKTTCSDIRCSELGLPMNNPSPEIQTVRIGGGEVVVVEFNDANMGWSGTDWRLMFGWIIKNGTIEFRCTRYTINSLKVPDEYLPASCQQNAQSSW